MIKIKQDPEQHSKAITQLNDAFRRSFTGGQVMITSGINALSEPIKQRIIQAVRVFDDFSPANDPYEEHDFGSLTIEEHDVFWKIDYYDKAMECGSSDPADPNVTIRVLTIMLSHEY